MSDTIVSGPASGERPERDRRRAALSIAAAALLHAAAILGVAFVAAATPSSTLPPISVSLLLASSPTPTEAPAVSESSGGASAAAAPLPETGSGGTQAAGGSGSGSDFVIPTPRAQASTSSTTAGGTGPGFRQAGGTTGGGASLPALQSAGSGATLPAAQSGSASGTAAGSTQHAGQGVAVTDPSAGAAKGSLDLSGLDKTLAGSSSGGSGAGRAGAAGTTGSGGAATGSGGGSEGGTGGSTGGAVAGPDYRVVWDQPEISKGREVVRADTPKIPSWVGKQGLTLSVSVSFTLGADGVLSGLTLEQSSGYPEVDSAVMDAIRRWRFTSARGASPIKGLIPYRITSH